MKITSFQDSRLAFVDSQTRILKPDNAAVITVSDDWTDNGSFIHNSGSVEFDGSSLQDVTAETFFLTATSLIGFIGDVENLYIVGAGTTPRAIMDELGLANTLLGIDAVYSSAVAVGTGV